MRVMNWRRSVCFLQMVMALGLGLEAPSAAACVPPRPTWWFYTLGDSFPADGATDVLTDGLVRVSERAWEVPYTNASGSGASPRHDVSVIDLETGAAVKGSLNPSTWGEVGLQYWRPESRLLPNRRYAVVQSLTQAESRPDTAQGSTQTRTSFTTGNRQAPALSVRDGLDTHMDFYEANVCDSNSPPGPCGGCGKSFAEWHHGVWVQVPEVQGGFTLGTYRVELVVTENTPYAFGYPGLAESRVLLRENLSSSGERVVRLLELPLKASTSARTCVAWRVLDLLGNVREGTPVCSDAKPMGPEIHPRPPDSKPGFPDYLGFGCTLGGEGLAPAALGLLALWLRNRRRAS